MEEFSDVPNGLRHGFPIGAPNPVTTTYTPENHNSAILQPDIIRDHIKTELDAGRYVGPFSRSELEQRIGPFQTAPLGAVEKSSAPGTFRIIQDFSFSGHDDEQDSLNSQIDTTKFPCVWGTFDKVAHAVSHAPPGSRAATMDVKTAYRQIPVRTPDQPHIVVKWGDEYYVDTRVPFGAASSNGLFARCGDSIAEMYKRRLYGHEVFKWVDDFLFIQHPRDGSEPPEAPPLFSEEAIYLYAAFLGWPWSLAKTRNFATIFRYLGFDWNLATRTVHIPDHKRTKYLTRLREWLDKGKVTLKDTESLVGALVHCALAIPDGRSRLPALTKFMAALPRARGLRFIGREPSPAARAEAEWWHDRLSVPHTGLSLVPPPPLSSIRVFTDASTSFGLGITLDDEFVSIRLRPGWISNKRDIGWAEATAVEMAVTWLVQRGVKDASIAIHCDNNGVVYAWKAGRSRNHQQNSAIRRIAATAATHNIHLDIPYVRTSENPADAPSRNVFPRGYTKAHDPPPVPPHLSSLLFDPS